MIKKILLTTLMLLTFIPVAQADSLPLVDSAAVKDRFVSNPRPVKDIGDPHIIREGDEYFAFATGGPLGFSVWRSADLKTFTKEKALKKMWQCFLWNTYTSIFDLDNGVILLPV